MKKIESKLSFLINFWFIYLVAFGLAFILSFSGLGNLLARWAVPKQSKIDEFLLSIGLGLAMTGLFVFLLGIFGIVNPVLYSLWTLLGLALFLFKLFKQWYPFTLKTNFQNPFTAISILIIVLFLLQAIPPLTTPVSSTDALEYHLLIPKIYLETGKISHIPSLLQSNYPCLAQYIYTLVLPLAGDIVCKSLHFWISIILLISIGRLCFRVSPGSNQILASALFLSMPVFSIVMGWAWNDAFFVFFMILTIGYLIDYNKLDDTAKTSRHLLMAGIMAGLALWTKYTFLMTFIALLPLFFIGFKRWRWKLKHILWFFIPLGILSSLVFLKNYLFTGNPLYPFLNNIFNSPFWSESAATYFTTTLRRLDIPNWSWTTYFTFPYPLILKPHIIDLHTGILPLVLAPILFIRSMNRELTLLKVFLLSSIFSWLLFQTGTRSLLTFFVIFFCISSIKLEQLLWKRKALKRIFIFFLALIILSNLGITLVTNFYLTHPIKYFIGQEGKRAFLLREARSHRGYDWLNRNFEVGKVLLVGLYGPYYLEKPMYFSSIGDPPITESLTAGVENVSQLSQKFKNLGITHIFMNKQQYDLENRRGLYSWSLKQRQIYEDFIGNFCSPVQKTGNQIIYKCKN